MKKEYGFHLENYDNGVSVETLKTGDGRTRFTNLINSDNTVSIGIGYGEFVGIGVDTEVNKTLDSLMGVKWLINFDNQESIDAMIILLRRLKSNLADLNKKGEIT